MSEQAIKESSDLESTIEKFFEMLKPHCGTLQQINNLLSRADVHDKGFSLETFRRHLDEKFRTGFAEFFGRTGRIFAKGSIYESSYREIIEARINGVKRRHAGEDVAEVEDKAANE